jgi:Domain of unknown function (DUF1833)
MNNQATSQSKAQMNILAPTELQVSTIVVEHGAVAAPVRMVVDNKPLAIGGNTYHPIGASITLPSDSDTAPNAQLQLDNVGGPLASIVDNTFGLRGAKVTLGRRFVDRPDVDDGFEIEFDVRECSMTQAVVTIGLGFNNTLDSISTPATYRQASSKALY